MNKIIHSTILLSVVIFLSGGMHAVGSAPEASFPKKHRAFFKTYCLDCHNAETQEGKVNLETLSFRINTLEQAELWQKILNAVNSGDMPPEDSNQPGNNEKADFLDDLAQTMVAARRALSDSGGKITMRRLNRRDYRNTIEHLTGVKVDVNSLPTDGGSGTFDTVGASQFISSDQFEQYLKLGRNAIDEAFERQTALKQKPQLFRVEPETTVNVDSLKSMRQLEETYERYKLWKAEVDKAAFAPENQQVMQQIREKYKLADLTNNVRLYQNANLLTGIPDAMEFGFRDSNAASFSYQGGYGRKYAYLKHYAKLPHSDRGTYLKLTWGIQRIDVIPEPKNLPSGTYRLRVRAGVLEGTPSQRHFIEIGHPQRVNKVRAGFASLPISSHHVTGTIDHPEVIETQLEVGLHTQKEFGIQERQPTNGRSLRDAYNRDKRTNGYGTPPAIWIDWIELEGPLPKNGPLSPLLAILNRHPRSSTLRVEHGGGEKPGAEKPDSEKPGTKKARLGESSYDLQRARHVINDFADAALRGTKPDPKFVDQLLAIFETRTKAGETFEVAIRTPLSVILASPGFLYLHEPRNGSEQRQLTDRELAVRLSYFLWSAPPDQQLLNLAEQNLLHKHDVIRKQVDRLVDDLRSDAFVSGFVHQWLDMERLEFFQFDPTLYREFDENTRAAARKEVYQSFAQLLRDSNGGRLGKLLKCDYVFINGLLGTYYGIDGVTGDEFRKVKLPAGSPRGGLLGMAAIHAMGSDGIVSSPVERGAWVLRHLLNDPPPPAPPNVPQISRLDGQLITKRERLRAHQEEAQCASCHRKIDPIGFGMENFNAAGKWRTKDSYALKNNKGKRVGKAKTWDIDPSGAFHQGPAFENYHELRNLIAVREEDFARGFTEHLMEYALGRPFGFADEELANEIVSSAKAKQFALSEFVYALVQSKAFRTK